MTAFWRKWWWWLLVTIALSHQFVQRVLAIDIPLVHAYLDDVLCIPIFLTIWNWERQVWWGAPPLKWGEILVFVLLTFAFFELVLPQYDPRFTADYWDGLAYLLGAFLYVQLEGI